MGHSSTRITQAFSIALPATGLAKGVFTNAADLPLSLRYERTTTLASIGN